MMTRAEAGGEVGRSGIQAATYVIRPLIGLPAAAPSDSHSLPISECLVRFDKACRVHAKPQAQDAAF